MKIDLKQYFENREKIFRSQDTDGPVITISREFGCEANHVALMLVERLNMSVPGIKKHAWAYISKEVLEESAKVLGMSPNLIEQRIQEHDQDFIRTFLHSFSSHYDVSDQRIIDKVKDVFLTYAKRGNVVMIGRGGTAVTAQFKNAIRIRLVAPLDWRASIVSATLNISQVEAEDMIQKMDQKRRRWVENFMDSKKLDERVFDMVINVKNLEEEEIVDMIMTVVRKRGYVGKELNMAAERTLKNQA